jgi:hypothetical protein
MQLVSIKMMVHLCVGMFTLVTSLFELRTQKVSILYLTKIISTVTSGVGACKGHVSMM